MASEGPSGRSWPGNQQHGSNPQQQPVGNLEITRNHPQMALNAEETKPVSSPVTGPHPGILQWWQARCVNLTLSEWLSSQPSNCHTGNSAAAPFKGLSQLALLTVFIGLWVEGRTGRPSPVYPTTCIDSASIALHVASRRSEGTQAREG